MRVCHPRDKKYRASLLFRLITLLRLVSGFTMPFLSFKSCIGRVCFKRRIGCRYSAPFNSALSSSALSAGSHDDEAEPRRMKYQELMNASTLSLAPMMEYTDRHFRHLVRLISSRTLLYTEMIAANALSHERKNQMEDYQRARVSASPIEVRENYDDEYLCRFLGQGRVEPLEGPSVLQLGGSDPRQMFEAAQTVMDLTDRGHCDYTAINLNCGCPSPKVAGKGCFGAALMDYPHLVADLTRAIHEGCDGRFPVTVKCRIGTDSHQTFMKQSCSEINPKEEYSRLSRFVETVAADGIVTDFSVHARLAVLRKSFSPADNRKIPPLKYDYVRKLVNEYPELTFTLNGGVNSIPQALSEFQLCPELKGVMIGRAWAADPWSFAMADTLLYGERYIPRNRLQILQAYGKHADFEESKYDVVKIRRFLVRAITPLFAGEANAKRYRVALDEIAGLPKKLLAAGKSLERQPALSELILDAAHRYLSMETLLRTPEESYERILWEEARRTSSSMPLLVAEWQRGRKCVENDQSGAEEESVPQASAIG